MTDFAYGLVNWAWIGLEYAAKGYSAAYSKGVAASQQYQDKRSKAAAREDPIVYSCHADDLAEYNYRPLRPKSYIRILVLEPGHGGELLRCSLEDIDLDSHPQFNALSYCWGDITDTRIISCDGCSMIITRNLYDALLRLRKPDITLRIWVDALCINQKDKPEKRQQIQLMRRIYQQSENCFAWLGPHTELDVLAFKLLNIIYDYLNSHPSDRDAKVLVPGKILAKYSTTPGEWNALSRLFARPWFERVWTLEEIVLPRQALIISGRFSFNAHYFFEIVDFIHSTELEAQMIGLEGGYLQSLKVAALRRELHEHSSEIDLLDTLRNARDRDAFDSRDKVLGVLGICRTDPTWASKLGYHLSPQEVYISVATHILTSSDPFRLFSACCPALECSGVADHLPSWVPDWSNRVATAPCIQVFERVRSYKAGGSNPPSIYISQSVNESPFLSVRGKNISSLKSFVDRYSDALKQDYKTTYHPKRSTCEKIGDWYFHIALGWVFECLDNEDTSRPSMTIEQFFLATCWSMTTASCGRKQFWETIACTLTNVRRNEALRFQSQLMEYAKQHRQHDSANPVQASFLHNLEIWTRVRKFCVTEEGQIGWVPMEAQQGDVICVFEGARLPYVLRRTADGDAYTIIGHCFIHGIMFGEVIAGDEILLEEIILR